jgi:hypothetical protein
MRKNMKIPRKKENPEQPVIIPRITRLLAWFEPTRSNQAEEMEVIIKNNVCKKMRKRLVNGSIARFRGSSRRREKNYNDNSPVSMDWNLHVKDCSSQIKQVRKKLIPERDPCMQI